MLDGNVPHLFGAWTHKDVLQFSGLNSALIQSFGVHGGVVLDHGDKRTGVIDNLGLLKHVMSIRVLRLSMIQASITCVEMCLGSIPIMKNHGIFNAAIHGYTIMLTYLEE